MKAPACLRRRVQRLGGYRVPGQVIHLFFDDGQGGVVAEDGRAFPSVESAKAALGISRDAQMAVITFVPPGAKDGRL